MTTSRPMNGERGGKEHDSHRVSLQSIADVFCSFLADFIVPEEEFRECLDECDDDESSVREIRVLGSIDE